MKTIISLLVALLMAGALVACKDEKQAAAPAPVEQAVAAVAQEGQAVAQEGQAVAQEGQAAAMEEQVPAKESAPAEQK